MSVRGIDHVGMMVRDLDRSLAFYHDLLGIPLLGRGEDIGAEASALTGESHRRVRYADLDLDGRILELLQYAGQPEEAVDGGGAAGVSTIHLGVMVTDLEETLARVTAAGFAARSQPVELTEPSYWAGARCAYVSDPDGTSIELVQRPGHSAVAADGTVII